MRIITVRTQILLFTRLFFVKHRCARLYTEHLYEHFVLPQVSAFYSATVQVKVISSGLLVLELDQ